MMRLTWLQSRTQNLVALGGLGIIAVVSAVTGPHLVHLYDSTGANCAAHGDCGIAKDVFLRTDHTLGTWLGVLVIVIPGVVGTFWGAPLVARELESGTHRLVWTQSVSRRNWLAVKIGILGLATVAVAGLLSLAVTWWANPLDRVRLDEFATFDQRNLVPVGHAAFAFVVGVAAGIVIRRTLPAMAATLVSFVAVRLAVVHWLRPHLLDPHHVVRPLTDAHHLGFALGPSGAEFVAGHPSMTNAWVLSSQVVDKAGHPASGQVIHDFVKASCPLINARVSGHAAHLPAPDPRIFGECVQRLSAKFDIGVTYQPPSHYWPLQGVETAIFLLAAAVLTGLCFWLVARRRV